MADDVALEPQVEPTDASPGAPEPVNWQAQASEWEKRAKGWQSQFTKLQQEQGNWQQTQAQLTQELTQTKAQFGDLESEKSTLSQQLDEWEKETEELTNSHNEIVAQVQKYELIRDEFPDLFGVSKLIPTIADVDAQRETLADWGKLMTEQINAAVQQQVKIATTGVTPPASPARTTQPNMDEIQARLNEIAGKPEHLAEYNRLMEAWLA